MTTRGIISIRHKGKYYVWFEEYSAFIEDLGVQLVIEWRKLTSEDIEKLKQNLETIESRWRSMIDYRIFSRFKYMISNVRPETIQDTPPVLDLIIDYVYIIDLDKNLFKIICDECKPTFRLDKVDLKHLNEFRCDIRDDHA